MNKSLCIPVLATPFVNPTNNETAMGKFSRLVRFIAEDGKTYYGNVSGKGVPKSAQVIEGNPLGEHKVTERSIGIKKILSPLDPAQVRSVRCLGLNYRAHAIEAKMPIPSYPILFMKPVTALTGPTDNIYIPQLLQTKISSDYECELVIVIGKKTRDVTLNDAMNHIAGFTVGNDVSHREWQIELGGSQWCFSKGFDTSAPFGPQIVSPEEIGDPDNLQIRTVLNGKEVQNSNTRDQIFKVRETVAFLSQGTTLLPGDLIFTGTPQGMFQQSYIWILTSEGVGMGRNPKLWLKHGDEVEVSLENVGSCFNKVVYEQHSGTPRSKL